MLSRALIFLVALGAALTWSGAELRAQEVYKPTQAQVALIKQGAQATRDGQYGEALRHYREAVKLGSFNLARLGLGRALQKSGECEEALIEFEKVRQDPAVEAPSRAQIEARLDEFIEELRASCPGSLVVTCAPPGLEVTLDGEPAACGERIERPAGTYTLRGAVGEREVQREVSIVALERVEVALRVEPAATPDPSVGQVEGLGRAAARQLLASATETASRARVEEVEEGLDRRLVGWGLVGLGGASLATGGVFTLLVLDNNSRGQELASEEVIAGDQGREVIDRGERYTTLQYVSYGVGAALVVSGVVLLVLDDAPPEEAARAGEGAWVGPLWTADGGWGAARHGRF